MQSKNRVNDHIELMGVGMSAKEYGQFRVDIMDIDCERTRISDFGWKHGAPPELEILSAPHARHTLFVCLAKHPVSWLKSLCARPYSPLEDTPADFSDFIRYAMPISGRDNLHITGRMNVVDLWNIKNAAYARLPVIASKCIVVAYEEILRDPERFLNSLGNYLLAKRSSYIWSLPSSKGDPFSFEDYREKYDLTTLRHSISEEDFQFISHRIDPTVLHIFGYQMD
jgi:hypothetical protein